MKNYIVELSSVEFSVSAESEEDALETVEDILEKIGASWNLSQTYEE